MGNAESPQSPELAGIGGFNDQPSFRRQSPNIARLVRGEHSQKMEYEFPINEHRLNSFRQQQLRSDPPVNSNHRFLNELTAPIVQENLCTDQKLPSSETSSLWFSLTSCFACRTRESNSSDPNPIRDKVHTIRIVRASNDLTPAVFDSHYNIITLEQLRECESNGSDVIESSNHVYSESTGQHENGSVNTNKSSSNRRMKRKKKKSRRTVTSDDDDDQEPERT